MPSALTKRVPQVFRRANTRARDFGDLGLVERRLRDGIRESSRTPSMIDCSLRPFRLELAQNPRQLRDLPIVEIELVGKESQRAAHAEGAPADIVACDLDPRSGSRNAAPNRNRDHPPARNRRDRNPPQRPTTAPDGGQISTNRTYENALSNSSPRGFSLPEGV